MFRIVCDPSSGSIELYLTEIRSGTLMFVACLVGVWQRNFEPVVCVYGTTYVPLVHKIQTSVSQAGFEPAIKASERPQCHALDRD